MYRPSFLSLPRRQAGEVTDRCEAILSSPKRAQNRVGTANHGSRLNFW
jgi:hypothetical protein